MGSPSAPAQSGKRLILDLLDVESEIPLRLTENFMMEPTAAVSGIVFAHPAADYFHIGVVDNEQLADYARRSGQTIEDLRRMMPNNVL